MLLRRAECSHQLPLPPDTSGASRGPGPHVALYPLPARVWVSVVSSSLHFRLGLQQGFCYR